MYNRLSRGIGFIVQWTHHPAHIGIVKERKRTRNMLTSTVLPSLTLTCNCILVNILLRSSQAVVFRSESSFRRPNLTDLLVTERLLAGHAGVESTIHCSVLCVENPLCVSFFYSPPSAQCRLHSVVLGYVFEPRTDNGSMYFVLQRGKVFDLLHLKNKTYNYFYYSFFIELI